MNEETKVDKDYKDAFNQGYEVARELGLKPNALNGIKAGNGRIQAMKDGMEQYGRELSMGKEKQAIPPLDLDSLENQTIHIEKPNKTKGKDKGLDMNL